MWPQNRADAEQGGEYDKDFKDSFEERGQSRHRFNWLPVMAIAFTVLLLIFALHSN